MSSRREGAMAPLISYAVLGIASACIGLVVVGAAVAVARGSPFTAPAFPPGAPAGPSPGAAGFWAIGTRTVGVCVVVGVLATILALPAAWAARTRPRLIALSALAPLLLPQYLVYASWGLLRAPGTSLGDWLERLGPGAWWEIIRWAQALGGLVLWAWPLALLVLAPTAAGVDASTLDALRLSGAGPVRTLLVVTSSLTRAILGAAGVVSLVMLGSAVPLHVAQIDTWAIAVWRELQETGGSPGAWRAALPLMFCTMSGGLLLAWFTTRERPDGGTEAAEPREPGSRRAAVLAMFVWCVAVVVPAVILVGHLKQVSSLRRFWQESGGSVWVSTQIALAVGISGVLIAAATCVGAGAPDRSGPRRAARWTIALWLAGALAPGVLIGSALSALGAASSRLGFVTDTYAGVVIAHIVRFGAVAALAGWWAGRVEPGELRDARLLAGGGLAPWWAALGRPRAGLFLSAGLVMLALSFHEIEAAVVVSPPSEATLSQHMLSLLHYLRDEQLTAGTLWMLLIGLAVASVAGAAMIRPRLVRNGAAAVVLLIMVFAGVPGCREASGRSGDSAPEPLPQARVIGEPGRAPGQFVKPRAIDTDGTNICVVDMTGRCQILAPDGKPVSWWTMPALDRGKPTGISWIDPPALPDSYEPVWYIADSHEHRVAAYRWPLSKGGDNPIAQQWGSYGPEPGHFTFPSDVLAVEGPWPSQPTGGRRYYVSEYGGNDRISIFGDSLNFLFSFGSEGDSDDPARVQFRRPQSLLLDAKTRTLVIADECNHRIGLFTLDGALKKWIGRAGAAPGTGLGEFNYPCGMCQLPDRTLLIAEQGNCRVQRVDIDRATGVAVYGRRGRGVGELDAPWGIAYARGEAYVCDAGNHRISVFRVPDLGGPG